jgi:hypothetical protein
MAYSHFTEIPMVASLFDLEVEYQARLFETVYQATPSDLLVKTLEEYEPLALAIGTEKARSELLIMPVLAEVRRLRNAEISLFSGVDFNVDTKNGLNGFCDYLFARDKNPYTIHAPVFMLVEAKNERINAGFAQCAAEMVAAQKFNEKEGNVISVIYGAVTTGELWRFLRLEAGILQVDRDNETLRPLERLLGILVAISEGK